MGRVFTIRRLATVVFIGAPLVGLAPAALAQNATWTGADGPIYTDAASWTPATVPTGTAEFSGSTPNNSLIDVSGSIGSLKFDAGAAAYTLTVNNNTTSYTLNGAGVVDNSSHAPTLTLTNTSDTLIFANSATAGDANVSISNAAILSSVIFNNSSTAGNAIIVINGTGSTLTFNGTSTATITSTGTVNFNNNSTAAGANITVTSGAGLNLNNSATLGSASATFDGATLTANNTTTLGSATINLKNGANLAFNDNSDGGTAAVISDGSAVIIDFSSSTGPNNDRKIAIGSLSGASAATTVYLGADTVSVGGNNQSTTFSGIITDCNNDCQAVNTPPNAPGVLVKVGTGTLTLTGANSYTGGTQINGGILSVSADNNLGAASGPISFNGGTLQFGAAFSLASTRSITLNSGGGGIDTNGFNITIGQAISGTGGLTKAGTNTLTLTAAETYSGATTISAGTLALSGSGSISASSGVTDNATFDISGTNGSNIVSLSGSGGVTLGSQTLTITNGSGTFSGVIAGSGGLALSGGKETLSGVNSYTGTTTIANGAELDIGTNQTAIAASGNVMVNGTLGLGSVGGTLTSLSGSGSVAGGPLVLTNASGTFSGVISGTSTLTLNAGTEILTGTNTYSGGTTISGGTLQLGAGSTSGSVVGNITDNGTLAFDHSDNVTYSNVISGTGALTQAGSGSLIFTGAETYSGGTTISSGTLQVGNGGTSGSITGNVADNGTFVFDHSDTVTFAGVISGSGAFQQIGSGNLILIGTSTLSGPTTVSNGILSVNGSLKSSAVTVASGGTLGGTGTVGPTTIASGGTLAPGNSIGTINIAGNLVLNSGSVYDAQFSPTASDKALVSGAASLSGTLLADFQTGVTYASGTQYTLITSAGPLSGTFASLNTLNLPSGLNASLSYDANDAYLTLSAPAAPVPPAPVLNAQDGRIHAAIRGAYIEDERLIRDAVLDHLAQSGEAITIWGEGFAGYGEIGNETGAGLHHSHSGGIAGVDAQVADTIRLGIAGAYTGGRITQPASNGTASGTAGHVIGYADWKQDAWRIDLGGEAGWGNDDVARTVSNLSETERDNQSDRMAQMFGEASYAFQALGGTFAPHADLYWVQATSGAFQEAGGVGALSGNGASDSETYSLLGIRALTKDIDLGSGIAIAPRLDLGWRHAFSGLTPSELVRFAGGTTTTILGVGPDGDAMAVQLGADIKFAPNLGLDLGYDGILSTRDNDHAVTLRLDWAL
jgi:autotransporter-associated beta strand protein